MTNNIWSDSSIANRPLPSTWLRALSNQLCLHHSLFWYRERTWRWSSRAAAGWSTSFQQTFHIIQLCPWQEKQVSRLTQKSLFHWSVILLWLNHSVEFTCECLWSCTFWGCLLGVPLTYQQSFRASFLGLTTTTSLQDHHLTHNMLPCSERGDK